MSLFSFGNKKLPKFIGIYNMTPARDCRANELGMCQAYVDGKCVCYAMQPEKQYPAVLPYRERQAAFWDYCVRECDINGFIEAMEEERKLSNIKYLRLNEAGDFRHQADVDFAILLADTLFEVHNIQVYLYTARHDLDYTRARDMGLRVIGSGFWKEGMSGTFSFAADDSMIYDDALVCPGDCTKCCICRDLKLKFHVIVRKH